MIGNIFITQKVLRKQETAEVFNQIHLKKNKKKNLVDFQGHK